ncbi:hypothetical protein H310_09805 [Aphanomyces invadans]|uniref:Stress-associated endoplasmic reticulum protein n=1 Tax=Aphanomyces invadans TaxID=157072 RepID=A0A024TSJ3_9STRA|nr:hypothetical protein H310_09805 [Aphanomyces invadans]ETV96949.1 hypothetical protein H310_09805 [Aphanomyces invadans]|eukprot:XP_008874195.1 hypothetical protein H310_09805 [Aphanomyces invadans]
MANPSTPAKLRLRSEKHLSNITKRGNVPASTRVSHDGYKVGPVLLGFLFFLVVGSAVLEVLRASQIGL